MDTKYLHFVINRIKKEENVRPKKTLACEKTTQFQPFFLSNSGINAQICKVSSILLVFYAK